MGVLKNTLFLFKHRRDALYRAAAAYKENKEGWRGRTRVRKRKTMKEVYHAWAGVLPQKQPTNAASPKARPYGRICGSTRGATINQPIHGGNDSGVFVIVIVIYSDDGNLKTAAIPRPGPAKLFATNSDEQSTG